jgi:hypothetical protein
MVKLALNDIGIKYVKGTMKRAMCEKQVLVKGQN